MEKKSILDRVIQVLTVLIAIVTAWNSFKLSSLDSEIKQSTLYNEILKDISTDKMILRQDVALLILNSYKKDDESNDDFIHELAFYFCTDTMRNAGAFNYARFLLENDKDAMRLKLIDSILATRVNKSSVSDPDLKQSEDSNKVDMIKQTREEINNMVTQSQKINFLSGKWTCLIQVKDNKITEDSRFKIFNDSLKTKALLPKFEELGTINNKMREIRFFNPEDRQFARSIKILAEKSGIDLAIKNYSQSGFSAPPGQLEVWIGSLD